MKQTAVVIAPGRGTYNQAELGYLARHHGGRPDLLEEFDAHRTSIGQTPVTALDGATRFSGATHRRGDNASALIFASAYGDFLAIDQDRIEILGVTGNSMGWYIALSCAGALSGPDGFKIANTMGTLMHKHLIGGQLVYPFVDENWVKIPGLRDRLFAVSQAINARPNCTLGLSIDLGGMMVLAGDEPGLAAFEHEMPKIQDRFPMRLESHAGFHSHIQAPVAEQGRSALAEIAFQQPDLPMIDGRGGFWNPMASDLGALFDYTLGYQVIKPYDFNAAIRVAARELMPDLFIVLGPGNTLSGAVAQSLVQAGWHGWQSKADFKAEQTQSPRLIAMELAHQRAIVT